MHCYPDNTYNINVTRVQDGTVEPQVIHLQKVPRTKLIDTSLQYVPPMNIVTFDEHDDLDQPAEYEGLAPVRGLW